MARSAVIAVVWLVSASGAAFAEPLPGLPTVTVRQFRFVGNTVFADHQLAAVVAPWQDLPVTALDIENARMALTRHYVDHGYISSGATVEKQDLNGGVVTFTIREGCLTAIHLHGNKRLRESFFRRRLLLADEPLEVNALRRRLQVLRLDYPIDRLNAGLKPGALPGEAYLDLKIREADGWRGGVRLANDRSPETGAEQLDLMLRSRNLTGHGDTAAASFGLARREQSWQGLDGGDLSMEYVMPIPPHDARIGLRGSRSSAAIIEEPFDALDITSTSETVALWLELPLIRTPGRELALSLTAERKRNCTELLGEPYDFDRGFDGDGETVVTALRLSARYLRRTAAHVLAGRITASTGLDALDATIDSPSRQGRFFALRGELQLVRKLARDITVIAAASGQWTDDALFAQEQVALGGIHSVRGYAANTLVRDRAAAGSIELRVPVVAVPEGGGRRRSRAGKSLAPAGATIALTPFLDAAWGADNRHHDGGDTIAAAGIGVRAEWPRRATLALFWGAPLTDRDDVNNNLLDNGIHVEFSLWMW